MVKNPSVAIIDIGSNSIKLLVATRSPDGHVIALAHRTIEARISAGISRAAPRLSEDGMSRGAEAVHALLAHAAPFSPAHIVLVATSAVRDAHNGTDFIARIRALTGHTIRILTGDQEANLIGRGLTCDPALTTLRDFYVFDLGGGSLECLAFRDRHIAQAVSLQLGCVRLTEKFIPDPAARFAEPAASEIPRHTRATVAASGFTFSLSTHAVAIGTGGSVTTVRAILAARAGTTLDHLSTVVTLPQLRNLLAELGSLSLLDRQQIPGLPPARADVFPAALATIITVAELGGFAAYHHSLYNLRYGLAADALTT